MNSEPKLIFKESFSICHWNLNSITPHTYKKALLFKTYIVVYKFDIIYLSERYLDYKTLYDDDNLDFQGFNWCALTIPLTTNVVEYAVSIKRF